jgi:serine/threonine protein kinase
MAGKIIDGKYEIISVVGQGGMGTVYLTKHLLLDKQVVLKMLKFGGGGDPQAAIRFQREAQAVCSLVHPNIVQVSAFGMSEENDCYLVMEYIKGKSLADKIEAQPHFPLAPALDLFAQIADALGYAHSKGLIHRDIKPSNVLVVEDEGKFTAKLIDFGLAKFLPGHGQDIMKLTQTGQVFGSPCYMSPEQCMGEEMDARSDIYSLGCLMYETITGQPVFNEETATMTLYKQVSGRPMPLFASCDRTDIPVELNELVLKTLAKGRDSRPQTMSELKEKLVQITQDLPTLATKIAKRVGKPVEVLRRKNKNILPIVGGALVVLAIAGGSGFYFLRDKAPVAPKAQKSPRELIAEAQEYLSDHERTILDPQISKTALEKWAVASDAVKQAKIEPGKDTGIEDEKTRKLLQGRIDYGMAACVGMLSDKYIPCSEACINEFQQAGDRLEARDEQKLQNMQLAMVTFFMFRSDRKNCDIYLKQLENSPGLSEDKLDQLKIRRAWVDVDVDPKKSLRESRELWSYYQNLKANGNQSVQGQIQTVKDTLLQALEKNGLKSEADELRRTGKLPKME